MHRLRGSFYIGVTASGEQIDVRLPREASGSLSESFYHSLRVSILETTYSSNYTLSIECRKLRPSIGVPFEVLKVYYLAEYMGCRHVITAVRNSVNTWIRKVAGLHGNRPME